MREGKGSMGWAASWLLFLILSLAAVSCVFAFVPPRTLLNNLSEGKILTNEELWFNQTLDHFSPYVTSLSLSLSLALPPLSKWISKYN